MGCSVKGESPQLPVRVNDGCGIRGRGLHLGTNGAQRVRTVDQDLTQCHRGRRSKRVEAAVCGGPEPFTELWHGCVSKAPRRSTQGAVRSQASSDHVGTHRKLTRFCEVDKMSEDITNPPSVAPGRCVPRSLVECLDLVRQLETLTS